MTEKGRVWYTSAELPHDGQFRSDCGSARGADQCEVREELGVAGHGENGLSGASGTGGTYIVGPVWVRDVCRDGGGGQTSPG
jgi:hypothetical protein